MADRERNKILPGSKAELDLFVARTQEFVESMSDEIDPEKRLGRLATFMIDFYDFVDGVDHRTSTLGTDSIQDVALQGRQNVRNLMRQHP
jgi:hypothetical protein